MGLHGGDGGMQRGGLGTEGFDGGERSHGGEHAIVFRGGESAEGVQCLSERGGIAVGAERLGGGDADIGESSPRAFSNAAVFFVTASPPRISRPIVPQKRTALSASVISLVSAGTALAIEIGGKIGGGEDALKGILRGVSRDFIRCAAGGAGVEFDLRQEANVPHPGEVRALGGAEFFQDGAVLGRGGEVVDFVGIGLEVVEFLGGFGLSPEDGLGVVGLAFVEELLARRGWSASGTGS